jgi:hypothetical protein
MAAKGILGKDNGKLLLVGGGGLIIGAAAAALITVLVARRKPNFVPTKFTKIVDKQFKGDGTFILTSATAAKIADTQAAAICAILGEKAFEIDASGAKAQFFAAAPADKIDAPGAISGTLP